MAFNRVHYVLFLCKMEFNFGFYNLEQDLRNEIGRYTLQASRIS